MFVDDWEGDVWTEQGRVLHQSSGLCWRHSLGAPGPAPAGRGQGEGRPEERAQQPQRDQH